MQTMCPECHEYIDHAQIDAHLKAHARADKIDAALDRVAKMTNKDLAARMRRMGRPDLAAKIEEGD